MSVVIADSNAPQQQTVERLTTVSLRCRDYGRVVCVQAGKPHRGAGMKSDEVLRQIADHHLHTECQNRVLAGLRELERKATNSGVHIHSIKSRLKSVSRIEQKVGKNQDGLEKATTIYEICPDLVGTRVVCLYRDDVYALDQLICNCDWIDVKNRELYIWRGERKDMQPHHERVKDSGYTSLHFVCGFGQAAEIDDRLRKCAFEIQVRTILEEAWAEMEHPTYEAQASEVKEGFRLFSDLLHVADGLALMLRKNTLVAAGSVTRAGEMKSFSFDTDSLPARLQQSLARAQEARATRRRSPPLRHLPRR